MSVSAKVDGILLRWGAVLFYPDIYRGQAMPEPKLPKGRGGGGSGGGGHTPAEVRARIQGVVSGSPQALVKILGKPSGMGSIRGRIDYMTRKGELDLTDDHGQVYADRESAQALADEWQVSGSFIPQHGDRREAFHIVCDMPAGTDPDGVREAALEFATREFDGHQWAWVQHTDRPNPHVHLLVKVEPRNPLLPRLDPRNADLRRWSQKFAQALRGRGIAAEATPRLTHGNVEKGEPIWMVKARAAGTLRHDPKAQARVRLAHAAMQRRLEAWGHVHNALAESPAAADRALAGRVAAFLAGTSMVRHMAGQAIAQEQRQQQAQEPTQQQRPERAQGRRR